MGLKIVHNQNITGAQRRQQHFINIRLKRGAVRCTVNAHRSMCPIQTHRRHQCRGSPMTMRSRIHQTTTAHNTTIQTRHVRFRTAFIEENKSIGIKTEDTVQPMFAFQRDVWSCLFGGVERLFLRRTPRRSKARETAMMLAGTPTRSRNSPSVASGCFSSSRLSRTNALPAILGGRQPPRRCASMEPVSRRRLSKLRIHAVLTPNRSAICRCDSSPRSDARTTRSRRSNE